MSGALAEAAFEGFAARAESNANLLFEGVATRARDSIPNEEKMESRKDERRASTGRRWASQEGCGARYRRGTLFAVI